MNTAYALSASVFAAVFLGSLIIYGQETARDIAIAAAFLACGSQFTAQDPKAYLASIYLAYAAFVAGILSYIALVTGY